MWTTRTLYFYLLGLNSFAFTDHSWYHCGRGRMDVSLNYQVGVEGQLTLSLYCLGMEDVLLISSGWRWDCQISNTAIDITFPGRSKDTSLLLFVLPLVAPSLLCCGETSAFLPGLLKSDSNMERDNCVVTSQCRWTPGCSYGFHWYQKSRVSLHIVNMLFSY